MFTPFQRSRIKTPKKGHVTGRTWQFSVSNRAIFFRCQGTPRWSAPTPHVARDRSDGSSTRCFFGWNETAGFRRGELVLWDQNSLKQTAVYTWNPWILYDFVGKLSLVLGFCLFSGGFKES